MGLHGRRRGVVAGHDERARPLVEYPWDVRIDPGDDFRLAIQVAILPGAGSLSNRGETSGTEG